MTKISDIKNYKEDDGKIPFEVIAVLKSINIRTAKNGSEFLMLDFGDNSASFSTMCFENSPAYDILKNSQIGDAFEVQATTDFYQGRISPKLDSVRKLEDSEIIEAYALLAPVSPYNPEKMQEELDGFIETISNESLRETVKFALESTAGKFFTSTAAVKMHHAYMFGLLEHSLRCVRMAVALAPLYPNINRDLVVAGTILHDIGKVLEYSQGLATDRTRIGILQGHVVLGYRIVRRAGLKCSLDTNTLEQLEHIVLSHQGEPEWGAAVRAATPEAIFVSNIDNFDAKMGAIEAAMAQDNSEFVDVPALRTKVLNTKLENKQ